MQEKDRHSFVAELVHQQPRCSGAHPLGGKDRHVIERRRLSFLEQGGKTFLLDEYGSAIAPCWATGVDIDRDGGCDPADMGWRPGIDVVPNGHGPDRDDAARMGLDQVATVVIDNIPVSRQLPILGLEVR